MASAFCFSMCWSFSFFVLFFFFNDTATTEIYTLSLHDALPICAGEEKKSAADRRAAPLERSGAAQRSRRRAGAERRSEEHTSELQSQSNLVCRLLLEKKKKQTNMQLSNTAHQINEARHHLIDHT